MITSKHLQNTHLLSTIGKYILKYAEYKGIYVISYIRIINIKHYQTTKGGESLSIRMIREGLKEMITCIQGIRREV